MAPKLHYSLLRLADISKTLEKISGAKQNKTCFIYNGTHTHEMTQKATKNWGENTKRKLNRERTITFP